jgi:hypothetical protein
MTDLEQKEAQLQQYRNGDFRASDDLIKALEAEIECYVRPL